MGMLEGPHDRVATEGLDRNSTTSSDASQYSTEPAPCTFIKKGANHRRGGLKAFEKDHLHVGRLLGSGGFGSVYEARYRGRTYAVKQWHKNTKNRRSTEESFEAEASTLHFRHPNIVRALHVLELDGFNSLLMEYGGERNLQELINCVNEDLGMARKVGFALDISRGLAFAHGQGLAHLDLKPSNVLVSTQDRCKIGDFGCCQNVGAETERPASPTKSSLTGTFAYRAPELLKGECPTTKADIYSLAICLWQMMVRDRPYGRENQHVVIFAVVAYQHRPKIPSEATLDDQGLHYTELMKQCWQAESNRRPSAREVVRTLKKWDSHCERRSAIDQGGVMEFAASMFAG